MSIIISHLAQVDARAELANDVRIGPFCVVGPHVQLGEGTCLDSHVAIVGHTTVGRHNRFFPGCVIGGEPQDISYVSGAPTRVDIGDGNQFREGVTVSRGAEKEDGVTSIGNGNLLMANCHVAHNCRLFDKTILVNGVLLGGHVHVQDGAIISGNSVVHHFATVGTLAFVSGGSRVPTDMPPFMMSAGSDRLKIATVNLVGMQRRGISNETISIIKRAHRLLFREMQGATAVRAHFSNELPDGFPPELHTLLDFLDAQKAGKFGRAGEVRRHLKMAPPSQAPEIRRAA